MNKRQLQSKIEKKLAQLSKLLDSIDEARAGSIHLEDGHHRAAPS